MLRLLANENDDDVDAEAEEKFVDAKRNPRRESKYLRMGRSTRAVHEDGPGLFRRPHYLRIGRAGFEEEEKRAPAAKYVRIGRLFDAGDAEEELYNDDDERVSEAIKRNAQRLRPQQYLRIGKRSAWPILA